MLNRLHLLILLRIDVHDVVEDHEVANMEDEVDQAHDDTDDQTAETARVVTLSIEVRENLEKDLNHHQHHDKWDVHVDEALPVLPDSVDAEGEEDHPDGQDEDRDEEGFEWSNEEGPNIYVDSREDVKEEEEEEDQVDDHHKWKVKFADDPEDAFDSIETARSVPLEEKEVHDEHDEDDLDHDNPGGDVDCRYGGWRKERQSPEDPDDGEGIDDDPHPAEDVDGRADPYHAAEAL